MSDSMPNNHHLREVLIFLFHSKNTPAKAHRELQKVYRDAAVSKTKCRNWFRRFKDSDFDVVDCRREERPKIFEDSELEAFLDVSTFRTSKQSHTLAKIQKQEIWITYDLKPRDIERRFFLLVNNCSRRKKRRIFFIAW